MDDKDTLGYYRACTLCPRRCGVDRTDGRSYGRCGSGAAPAVNLAMLHYGEEPVISGSRGSGTVFFEGCPLGCIFCQNHVISGRRHPLHEMTVRELADTFVSLQEQGAHNINLVTPLHFAPSVARALEQIRGTRLTIPVAVNTGGYELPETLRILDGLVDIYMPDLKFCSPDIGRALCSAPDYFDTACRAIDEMYRRTGPVELDDNGMMRRGLVIRHLMLPGKLFDTKKILDHIIGRYGDNVFISLMGQYTPMPTLPENAPGYLRKTVSEEHYDAAVRYLQTVYGDTTDRIFIQDMSSIGDGMIPPFRAI